MGGYGEKSSYSSPRPGRPPDSAGPSYPNPSPSPDSCPTSATVAAPSASPPEPASMVPSALPVPSALLVLSAISTLPVLLVLPTSLVTPVSLDPCCPIIGDSPPLVARRRHSPVTHCSPVS